MKTCVHWKKKNTSTRAAKAAVITPKTSPASKVGEPHWRGYDILTLNKTIYKIESLDPKPLFK
jgi:hypothetical protein